MSTDSQPEIRDPLLGELLGGEFEIKEKLGEGGMGAVYLATQKLTQRDVAIKVLLRSLYDENLFNRFRQEAQIVSKLSHPGIITVYTYGQHTDRTLFIAMEFVRGKTLADLLEDSRGFDVDRALPLMIQMADALAYAHDQKIRRSRKGITEFIPSRGTWLGVLDDIQDYLTDTTVPIEDGDIILLYTDGVTEAADKNGVMFGERNLERALNKYAHLPCTEIVKNIILDVQAHMAEQKDDLTLLALKRTDAIAA